MFSPSPRGSSKTSAGSEDLRTVNSFKFTSVFFRFTNLESENMRAMERSQLEEQTILELEEELRVVGSNLQQLEVSEEKALEREETYQRQIHELLHRSGC
jgi:tropomyosin-1